MFNKINNYFVIALISTIYFSCAENNQSPEKTNEISDTLIENISLSERLNIDSGEVKIFTMPTPLQIASALKIMEVEYNGNLLTNRISTASKTNIELSLLLGIYNTDLGYTTVYNNNQKSLDYISDIQTIMDKLSIEFYVNKNLKKKFKENINNQDSLSNLILKVYNEANQYMTSSDNEGLGLLILTGGYIEGLYLAVSSNVGNNWKEEKTNLLIQQKLFLDNFIVLLDGYTSNTRIKDIFSKFQKLKLAFDVIKIKYSDKTESYELTNSITLKDELKIKKIITKLRNDILKD